MFLIEGQLKNFRQHTFLDVPVSGNLIGVVGPNGRGKSNLIASVQYCLTGEIPGVVKEKLLRWGAEDEAGYTQWTFQHEKIQATVHRGVGREDTWMKVQGHKHPIKGVNKVNDALFEMLGIDKDIGRSIFVQQAELDRVLFDLPSKREQAFQRLCGMGSAAKIHQDIGNFVGQYLPTLPDFGEQIAEANRQRVEFNQRLEQLQGQLAQLDGMRPAMDPAAIESDLKSLQTIIPVLGGLMAQLSQLAGLTTNIAQANAVYDQWKARGGDIDVALIDKQISETRTLMTACQAYSNAKQAYDAKALEVQRIGDPPYRDDQVEELRKAAEHLQQSFHEANGRLQLFKSLETALRSAPKDGHDCPACGQAIENMGHVLKHVTTQIQQASQQAATDDPRQAVAVYQDAGGKLSVYSRMSARVRTEFEMVERQLKSVPEVIQDMQKLNEALQGMERARGDVLTASRQMQQADTQRQMYSQHLGKVCAEIEAVILHLRKMLGDSTWLQYSREQFADPAVYAAVAAKHKELEQQGVAHVSSLQGYRAYEAQRAGIVGQQQEMASNISRIDNTLRDLTGKRDQQGTYVSTTKILTDVRDFYHYSQGPHALSGKILTEMNADVNMFLQRLNAPYSVVANDAGLSYMVQFHDGRAMPAGGFAEATDLSGGQRVLLAVAFRLANYVMFASKMGLLSLDEPTAYLDDNNINNFCLLLETLKGVAKSLELQLIMSTHERQTMPFMDSVIDLGKVPNDISAK